MNHKTAAVVVIAVVILAGAGLILYNEDRKAHADDPAYILHGNGGVLTDGSETYENRWTLEGCRFSNADRTFVGWNSEPDGKGEWHQIGERSDDRNIDLYAQWGFGLKITVIDGTSDGILDGYNGFLTYGNKEWRLLADMVIPSAGAELTLDTHMEWEFDGLRFTDSQNLYTIEIDIEGGVVTSSSASGGDVVLYLDPITDTELTVTVTDID